MKKQVLISPEQERKIVLSLSYDKDDIKEMVYNLLERDVTDREVDNFINDMAYEIDDIAASLNDQADFDISDMICRYFKGGNC